MSLPVRVSLAEARALLAKARKPSKYRAKAIVVDGVRFDSQKEARRWSELQLLERAGAIRDLAYHVVFDLHAPALLPDGSLACRVVVAKYEADFVYYERDVPIVEDAKGCRTAMYRLKRRWMLAEYGIQIRET